MGILKNKIANSIAFSLLLFFIQINNAFSVESPPIFIPTGEQQQSIRDKLEYLTDPESKYTISEIASGDAGTFKPFHQKDFGFGYKGVLWIRFTADLTNYHESHFFLTQNYEHVGDLTLFYPTQSGLGTLRITEQTEEPRTFKLHNYLFKVPTSAVSSATYYLRFVPAGHPAYVDLSWYGTKGILEHINNSQLEVGLFFGGLVVMLFYNFILCVYLRSRAYLYYIYYLACLIMTLIFLNGYVPLIVQISTFWERMFATFTYLMFHAMCLFTRNFLSLNTSVRWLDIYLKICQWAWLIFGFGTFFIPIDNPYTLLNYLTVISVPFLIAAGWIRVYQGYVPARIYSVGWTIFAAAALTYILVSLKIFPATWRTNLGLQFASVLEAVLFALALAYRIKLMDMAATAAKNAFLVMISHELKTPLQGIVSSLDLLTISNSVKGKDAEVWNRLRVATEHLEMQMKDLTDYARLGSGKMQVRNFEFNATASMSQIIEDLRQMAEQKGLFYETEIDNSNLIVRSDALRIQQILNNLIVNAIKYTESGYVKVQFQYIQEKSLSIVLRIEDSGVGISKKNVARIFEPFTQIDETSTRKYGGIGMGLAIVRQLVSLLKGTIKVESDLGKGTKFEVRIPVDKVEDWNTEANPADGKSINNKILLVDDTDEIRCSLKQIVEKLEYRCDVAECGQNAVNQTKSEKYAAILLDVNMPDMDGFSVAKEIRKSRNRQTPIIWISATPPHLSTLEQRELFTYFLEKPVRKENLSAMLRKILA